MALSRRWTGIMLVYAMAVFSFLSFKRGQLSLVQGLAVCANCIQPQVGYQLFLTSSQT